MERERERELWHGILFEEPNPEQEPPTRPNWALEVDDTNVYSRGNRAPVNIVINIRCHHEKRNTSFNRANRKRGEIFPHIRAPCP